MSKITWKTTGNVTTGETKHGRVKYYATTRTKGEATYSAFFVADHTSGKRRLKAFASEEDAIAKAKEILEARDKDGDELRLTGDARLNYMQAMKSLPPGARLDLIVSECAAAKARLGDVALATAVDFYLKNNAMDLPQRTVSEVLQEMKTAKEADGVSAVYLKDLDFRLGKFAEAFQVQISTVGTAQVNQWLRRLKCSGRGRNNYRLALCTLFKFAESSGYLPKNHLDFDTVPRATEKPGAIGIFTPKEMLALLHAAQPTLGTLKPGYNRRYADAPGLLPVLLLGGFAGMRTSEIERQLWEDILLERGFIRVTDAKGNTARKRLVPIPANLQQWLAPLRKQRGPVCEIARTPDALARLAERAGIEWKANGLRHSFVSYRCAETQNVAQTALEAGNSPEKVFKNYRELVTPGEAIDWFSISPEDAKNVINLKKAS